MKTLTPEQPRSVEKDAVNHALYREMEVDTLARTLWGEARGEGTAGMLAVANVILNRVKIAQEKGGMWWGNSIIQVCQKPYQFSCWNRTDANFKKLLRVDQSDLYFASALRIARRAVYASIEDMTNGADHYHAVGAAPYWAKNEKPVTVIGNHIFYKLSS